MVARTLLSMDEIVILLAWRTSWFGRLSVDLADLEKLKETSIGEFRPCRSGGPLIFYVSFRTFYTYYVSAFSNAAVQRTLWVSSTSRYYFHTLHTSLLHLKSLLASLIFHSHHRSLLCIFCISIITEYFIIMADEESSSPPTTTNGEQKEDTGDTPIATEGPADAAVQLNKKKRLCRHPVSSYCVWWVVWSGPERDPSPLSFLI
jgi:hypothetical protein